LQRSGESWLTVKRIILCSYSLSFSLLLKCPIFLVRNLEICTESTQSYYDILGEAKNSPS
jgi:hypothetical protein